jgi:hypothetical protein
MVDKRSVNVIARYKSNGCLDSEFRSKNGFVGMLFNNFPASNNDEIFGLALQADGSCITAGASSTARHPCCAVARYTSGSIPLMAPMVLAPLNYERFVNASAITVRGFAVYPGFVTVFLDDTLLGSTPVSSGQWQYTLPALKDGKHCVRVMQDYPGGRTQLLSSITTCTVDQQPVALDEIIKSYAGESTSGILRARGASGEYRYQLISATNGRVILNDNNFTFIPMIERGMGNIRFKVTDIVSGYSAHGMITVHIYPKIKAIDPMIAYQDRELQGNLSALTKSGKAPYRFERIGEVINGTLTLCDDGTFTFVPRPDFFGEAVFYYSVIDANKNVSERLKAIVSIQRSLIAVNKTEYMIGKQPVHDRCLALGGSGKYRFKLLNARDCKTTIENGLYTCMPNKMHGDAEFKFEVIDEITKEMSIGTIRIVID